MHGNPVKGEVGFHAGGEPYTLVLSIDALCKIEGLLGKTSRQAHVMLTGGSIEAMRAYWWAALQEHHPELSVRAAGELIYEVDGDKDAAALINRAIELANPKARKEAKKKAKEAGAAKPDPQPTADGTGKTSSPDGASSA